MTVKRVTQGNLVDGSTCKLIQFCDVDGKEVLRYEHGGAVFVRGVRAHYSSVIATAFEDWCHAALESEADSKNPNAELKKFLRSEAVAACDRIHLTNKNLSGNLWPLPGGEYYAVKVFDISTNPRRPVGFVRPDGEIR